MKHKGNGFEYAAERDADLQRAWREQISSREKIIIDDVFSSLVDMPSKRFWVSSERAGIVISKMIRMGEENWDSFLSGMRGEKKEMYRELALRVKQKMLNEKIPFTVAVSNTVNEPAPRFYLTPKSAKIIFYKMRRRLKKKRDMEKRNEDERKEH